MSMSLALANPQLYPFPESWEESWKDGIFSAGNPVMTRIQEHLVQFAAVNIPVLLLGESGVGKEVYARKIHRLSSRRHQIFMKVNCAALPGELLESELFGYEAGAFTGAVKSKPGMFQICNGGTIFLDEIGELPPNLQAKLLQVLQDRQFSRLGGRSLISVDVRILAATNVDIHYALATKKFREDLYYRLNAFTIHLPPLRERREEILPLLEYFMQRLGPWMGVSPKPISDEVIATCRQYSWPGNVRELENFVKRLLVLDDEASILAELKGEHTGKSEGHLGPQRLSRTGNPTDLKVMVRGLKAQAEKEAIQLALTETGGSRKEAARLLNICTKALLQKVRQYGLGTDAPSNLAGLQTKASEPTRFQVPVQDDKEYS
jgi:transcriptional regulator with PAS, ATPase and Fis domain